MQKRKQDIVLNILLALRIFDPRDIRGKSPIYRPLSDRDLLRRFFRFFRLFRQDLIQNRKNTLPETPPRYPAPALEYRSCCRSAVTLPKRIPRAKIRLSTRFILPPPNFKSISLLYHTNCPIATAQAQKPSANVFQGSTSSFSSSKTLQTQKTGSTSSLFSSRGRASFYHVCDRRKSEHFPLGNQGFSLLCSMLRQPRLRQPLLR